MVGATSIDFFGGMTLDLASPNPPPTTPRSPSAVPEGAPARDLNRSPAARRVGDLAARSSLLMANFEHRVHLPMPALWVPEDRPDLHHVGSWEAGTLVEGKYATFRHDQLVGSFHPAHRAKWTAHELAHGLIGFAWRPGAPAFFHALAARLAEIVPVALYYFFDEAYLKRCPLHAGGGPLFRTFCRACEDAADPANSQDPEAAKWLEQGLQFVHREIACVRQSRREGRCIPHHVASLELSSDSLAYAAAHQTRLNSYEFHRYVELFHPTNTGWHESLDALEARVLQICDHIIGERDAAPLDGDRWRWVTQDVGWRLLWARAMTPGYEVEFDALTEDLASNPTLSGIEVAINDYRELHARIDVPAPEDLFAVGYDLPEGYGRSLRQVIDGVASAFPATIELLGWKHTEVVAEFIAADRNERKPLGHRFAQHLGLTAPRRVAELSSFEAAVAHAQPLDLACVTFGPDGPLNDEVQLAPGLQLIHASYDVVELAQSLQAGQPTIPPERPTHLAIARLPNGELFIADLTDEASEALSQLESGPWPRQLLRLSQSELDTLEELGIIVPSAWDADAVL